VAGVMLLLLQKRFVGRKNKKARDEQVDLAWEMGG